jgi:uncharacterized protein
MTTNVIERRRSAQYSAGTASGPRMATTPGGDVFFGHAVPFDSESEDVGGFLEVVRRGAFAKALASSDNIFAILDHDKKVTNVLGSTGSGTLQLVEDEEGLAFIIQASDTQAAQDAAKVVRQNRIGVSFAFVCGRQNWTTKPDGTRLREILEVSSLEEISLVVDPAYKSSDVSVLALHDNRSKPTPVPTGSWEEKQRPSVDYLRRQLDLAECEWQFTPVAELPSCAM